MVETLLIFAVGMIVGGFAQNFLNRLKVIHFEFEKPKNDGRRLPQVKARARKQIR